MDSTEIKIYKEADPSKLPWGELGVDVVLECTGFFTSKESHKHILMLVQKGCYLSPAGDDLQQ